MPYENDHRFNQEDLYRITGDEVYQYCCLLSFGAEYPCEEDVPISRSSTVEFIKKALSYYMSNMLLAWNEETKVGNPTRSVDLNDLIKSIKNSR